MLQKSPMCSYIPAKDLARARKFYEETVGLKLKQEINGGVAYEFGGGAKAAWFKDSEGNTMAVVQTL